MLAGQAQGVGAMMDEQLKEKIAKEIGEWCWRDSFYGEYVTENDRISCRVEVGFMFDLITEAGYVRLAADQDCPSPTLKTATYVYEMRLYLKAQQDMLKAGFRKVEL